MSETLVRLQQLLDHFDTAMLVSIGSDDMMRARPMHIAASESDAELWFLTNRGAERTEDVSEQMRVAITMQGGGRFVSLTGLASIVDDRERCRELWSVTMQPWFPGGARDPNLVAIRFVPTEGEYWDASGTNIVRMLYEGAKAVVRGDTPHVPEPEQHGTVDF